MPHCNANGVSLYYELTGSGERLLCISGTGGDLRQTPKLTDGPFAEAFEILAYDQRGLGQSSVPAAPYSMADFADDAAALLDAVGWEDCLVFGVSFGGMVAQEFAIRYPSRVRRLALACTSAGGRGGGSYPLQNLFQLDAEQRTAQQMELLDTRWDAAWRAEHPDQVQLIADRMLRGRGEDAGGGASVGLANQLAARAGHDTADRLAAITSPTFVSGGRFDGIAPPSNSEFLARAIPGAQLTLYDGGHIFFVQDAAAIPDTISFLRGERRKALPA